MTKTDLLHHETKLLPVDQHTTLLATQALIQIHNPTHPNHNHALNPRYINPPRPLKQSIFTKYSTLATHTAPGFTPGTAQSHTDIHTRHPHKHSQTHHISPPTLQHTQQSTSTHPQNRNKPHTAAADTLSPAKSGRLPQTQQLFTSHATQHSKHMSIVP